MHNHYEQERQVKVVINKYHQESIRERQRRIARGDQPNWLVATSMHLHTSLAAAFIAARAYIRREPTPHTEAAPYPGIAAEPVDTTISA